MSGQEVWNYDVDPEEKKGKKDKSVFYPYMNAYGSAQFTPAKFFDYLDYLKKNQQENQDLAVLSFRKERYLFCEREDGTVFSVQLVDDRVRTKEAISSDQLHKEEIALARQIQTAGIIQVYEGAVPDDDNEISSPDRALKKGQQITFLYALSASASSESLSSTPYSSDSDESVVGQEVVVNVYTEEDFLKKHGIEFKRYPTTNGKAPGLLETDAFIKDAVRGTFTNIWGHCHGGNSRTAMYMAMYDYIYLINNAGARDIKAKQIEIGICIDPWSHNKLQPPARMKYDSDANGTNKYEASMRKYEARQIFLQDFKNYIDSIKKENGRGFKEHYPSWSDWQASKDYDQDRVKVKLKA